MQVLSKIKDIEMLENSYLIQKVYHQGRSLPAYTL